MAGSVQGSVGTAPTLLVSAPPVVASGPLGGFSVQAGTTATLYLGAGTGVTTSSAGGTIAGGGTFQGYLFAGDNLYGVTASGTVTAYVLTMGL